MPVVCDVGIGRSGICCGMIRLCRSQVSAEHRGTLVTSGHGRTRFSQMAAEMVKCDCRQQIRNNSVRNRKVNH